MLHSHLFSGIAQFTDQKPISDEIFVSVQSWTPLFCIFSFSWPFRTNVFPVSIPKISGVMHELYTSWLGSYRQQMSNAMTAIVKCIITCLYVAKKEKKKIFMAPFYGWGSTASRLKPLWGGSLFLPLSSQKFLVLFYQPQKYERLSQPCTHPVVFNTGNLDWQSSALTTWPLM